MMIPSLREISYALFGAWRLVHFDQSGLSYFDRSVQGFWKSFFAAAIVAPGYAGLVLVHLEADPISVGPLRFFFIEALGYVVLWLAFPVIAHWILEALKKEANFIVLVVALNWAAVIELFIFLPIRVISEIGVLPEGATAFLLLATMLFLLAYEWFVVRCALGLSGATAAGFIICKTLLELMIGQVTDNVM